MLVFTTFLPPGLPVPKYFYPDQFPPGLPIPTQFKFQIGSTPSPVNSSLIAEFAKKQFVPDMNTFSPFLEPIIIEAPPPTLCDDSNYFITSPTFAAYSSAKTLPTVAERNKAAALAPVATSGNLHSRPPTSGKVDENTPVELTPREEARVKIIYHWFIWNHRVLARPPYPALLHDFITHITLHERFMKESLFLAKYLLRMDYEQEDKEKRSLPNLFISNRTGVRRLKVGYEKEKMEIKEKLEVSKKRGDDVRKLMWRCMEKMERELGEELRVVGRSLWMLLLAEGI